MLEVTTTSVAPVLVAAGVVPVIWVALTTVRLPSSVPPMVTLVTLTKFVPVMVTLVPPAMEPVAGLTAVTDRGEGPGPQQGESLQPGVATAARRLPTIPIALVSAMSLPLRWRHTLSPQFEVRNHQALRLTRDSNGYAAGVGRTVAELSEEVVAPAVRGPARCET